MADLRGTGILSCAQHHDLGGAGNRRRFCRGSGGSKRRKRECQGGERHGTTPQTHAITPHSITRPCTITKSTSSSTVTSASGLPSTAMISAEQPGASLPIWLHPQHCGSAGGGAGQHFAVTALLAHQAQFLGVAAMLEHAGVGAEHNRDTIFAGAADQRGHQGLHGADLVLDHGGVDALAQPFADAFQRHQGWHQHGAIGLHRRAAASSR